MIGTWINEQKLSGCIELELGASLMHGAHTRHCLYIHDYIIEIWEQNELTQERVKVYINISWVQNSQKNGQIQCIFIYQ